MLLIGLGIGREESGRRINLNHADGFKPANVEKVIMADEQGQKWQNQELSIVIPMGNPGPEFIDRTWRERWLSWPWRPWVKQKRSTWSSMMLMREESLRQMRSIVGTSIYH